MENIDQTKTHLSISHTQGLSCLMKVVHPPSCCSDIFTRRLPVWLLFSCRGRKHITCEVCRKDITSVVISKQIYFHEMTWTPVTLHKCLPVSVFLTFLASSEPVLGSMWEMKELVSWRVRRILIFSWQQLLLSSNIILSHKLLKILRDDKSASICLFTCYSYALRLNMHFQLLLTTYNSCNIVTQKLCDHVNIVEVNIQ